MNSLVVSIMLVAMTIIIICMSATILIKKKIYNEYILKRGPLSLFDYLMDYDGNWFFKEIDYHLVEQCHRDNQFYVLKKRVKLFFWITVITFVALLFFGAISKFI